MSRFLVPAAACGESCQRQYAERGCGRLRNGEADIASGVDDTVAGNVLCALDVEHRGQVRAGGKLVIAENANVTVNCVDANGGAAIWVYAGGEVEINGGTFVATGGDKATDSAGIVVEPGVINNSGKVTINGGKFQAPNSGCYAINNSGQMIINGGEFSAYRGLMATTAGTITVNNGKFEVTGNAGGWVAYTSNTGKIVINGGQFSSVAGMFTGNVEDKR